MILPYLTILSEFRDKIRTHARDIKALDILKECDKLRDDILPNVGVRLEDKEGKKYSCNILLWAFEKYIIFWIFLKKNYERFCK